MRSHVYPCNASHDRVDAASTVIASQFPPETFGRLIDDATAGDAILDRIVHDAIIVNLTGESMRKLKAQCRSLED